MKKKITAIILAILITLNICSLDRADAFAPAIPVAAYYVIGGVLASCGVYCTDKDGWNAIIANAYEKCDSSIKSRIMQMQLGAGLLFEFTAAEWASISKVVGEEYADGQVPQVVIAPIYDFGAAVTVLRVGTLTYELYCEDNWTKLKRRVSDGYECTEYDTHGTDRIVNAWFSRIVKNNGVVPHFQPGALVVQIQLASGLLLQKYCGSCAVDTSYSPEVYLPQLDKYMDAAASSVPLPESLSNANAAATASDIAAAWDYWLSRQQALHPDIPGEGTGEGDIPGEGTGEGGIAGVLTGIWGWLAGAFDGLGDLISSIVGALTQVVDWVTAETEGDVNWEPLRTGGIAFTTMFPFSLPWDLYRLISQLNNSTSFDPVIHVAVATEILGDGLTFDIDLSMWENVLPFVRGIELLMFDIMLIFATRKLLGGAQ